MKEINNELNKTFDIVKCVSVGTLEFYLGINYFDNSDYRLPNRKYLTKFEELYNGYDSILYFLSLCDEKYLKNFFINKHISVSNFIGSYSHNNFFKFLEIYHRKNGTRLDQELINLLGYNTDQELQKLARQNIYSSTYCRYHFEKISSNDYYEKLESYHTIDIETLYKTFNAEYTNETMYAFFKLVLEFDLIWVIDKIQYMQFDQIDLLCCCILEPQFLPILLENSDGSQSFRQEFLKRFGTYKSGYGIPTIAVFGLIHGKIDNEEAITRLDEFWESRNVYHIRTWEDSRYVSHAVGLLLNKTPNNVYSWAKLGYSIFLSYTQNYKNTDKLSELWIEDLINANYRCETYNVIYGNSRDLGIYISSINASTMKFKEFVFQMLKYKNQIYLPSVVWEIYKRNSELFNILFNKSFIEKVYSDYKDVKFSYEEKIDFYFKFATMFFKHDKDKSELLFILGLNQSFVRPIYRNEDYIDTMLVCALYYAYTNYWLSYNEVKTYAVKINEMLKIMQNAIDEGDRREHLKWFVDNYIDDEELIEFVNIDAEKPLLLKLIKDKDIQEVTDEVVKNIFNEGNEGFGFSTWSRIVEHDKFNVKSLLDVFSNKYLPLQNNITYYNDYCYALAALLSKDEYIENANDYVKLTRNKYSSLSMIIAFSMLNKSDEAKQLIKNMFSFAELLVKFNDDMNTSNNKQQNKINNKEDILSLIYSTSNEDWGYSDESIYTLQNNKDLKIISDDFEEAQPCMFDWARNFSDENAYRHEYKIIYKENVIDNFALVAVDGYRAYLPFPFDYEKKYVKRSKYHLARIMNPNEDNYRRYLEMSGLKII